MMTRDELQTLLSQHFSPYREWNYSQWAKRIEEEIAGPSEHLTANGTAYQFELDVLWDDREHGHIRVCASLWVEPQKRWLGFLPIYAPDISDGFIVSPPEGVFLDESRRPES